MKVTSEMVAAGQEIASLLMDAQVVHCMGGLGGAPTEIEIPDKYKEMVQQYLDHKIMSVECIFKAMYMVST